MSLDEFKKNLSKEQALHNSLGILLSMVVFGLLIIIYQNETSNNLPLYVLLVPISYLIIFLVIYERKFFIKRIKSKTSEYFFTILTFERAIIRFKYIEKFHKYSIIALIIISILVSIGIYFTIADKEVQLQKYYSQQKEYEDKVRSTYNLSEEGLREYFYKQISQMTTLQVDQRIVTIFGNELLEENENTTFAEFHQPGNEILWKTPSDLDRRLLLHAKYDEMSYLELKKILSNKLEKLKPSPFIDEISNNTFIEFLVLVWTIPAIQVYVIFPFKYSLTKFPEFYSLISKASFIIVSKFVNLDEMTKRKYLLIGLNYYEKYIKENIGWNINRFDEIKSVCVNYDSDKLSMLAYNFVECLESHKKHALLYFIQNKIQVSNSSQFLIHISLSMKIKENWKFIATATSTLIALIPYIATLLAKP